MIIICPHCFELIEIEALNCCIFRHGIYKNNFNQIDPHLNKIECDELFNSNKIYGCGKPFQIIDNCEVKICGYI
jgi:hypothetical protein